LGSKKWETKSNHNSSINTVRTGLVWSLTLAFSSLLPIYVSRVLRSYCQLVLGISSSSYNMFVRDNLDSTSSGYSSSPSQGSLL